MTVEFIRNIFFLLTSFQKSWGSWQSTSATMRRKLLNSSMMRKTMTRVIFRYILFASVNICGSQSSWFWTKHSLLIPSWILTAHTVPCTGLQWKHLLWLFGCRREYNLNVHIFGKTIRFCSLKQIYIDGEFEKHNGFTVMRLKIVHMEHFVDKANKYFVLIGTTWHSEMSIW